MKSRTKGNKYEILIEDNDIYSIKINKRRADKTLSELSAAAERIRAILKQTYESDSDYDLYRLIEKKIFEEANIDLDNGDIWKLKMACESIKELQELLASHNDDIQPPEYKETLGNLGYTRVDKLRDGTELWAHVLEDTEEKEVTEEIVAGPEGTVKRIRTIIWEKTDGGRRSQSIIYRKKPIGKKLLKIVRNTMSNIK